MSLLTTTTLVFAALLSPAETSNPQRTAERTVPLSSAWVDPLDVRKVELANPFAVPGLTKGPILRNRDIPSKMPVTLESWFTVDVDVEGNGTKIRRLVFPSCEPGVEHCETFDQLARQVSKWSWTPAKGEKGPVATRATLLIRLDWLVESISVAKVAYGPIEPDQLPPAVRVPPLSLEAFVEISLAKGGVVELPAGMVSVEKVAQPPLPPSKSVDVSSRTIPVAGDLLMHVTSTGTVDRVLPLDVRPPVLWPVWKKAISAWKFDPAKAGETATDAWVRLELKDAKAEISAESTGLASVKKDVPLPPPAAPPTRP